jgi:hypothetical protein
MGYTILKTEAVKYEGAERRTCKRCMLFSINSFSRASAPRSDDARGNERFIRVRTGLGIT